MPHVGFRFYPTEQELLEYYLFNKIIENPLLYEDGEDIPIRDCNLYGGDEPSDIWKLYGGNHLLENQALYFFTQLKKVSPKGSRFNRKIGSGSWQGEDGAKPVLARGSDDHVLGFKKRFRYESSRNAEENERWIMHEYTIIPSLLGPQYSHEAIDFVLCRIKKNESEQHIEKANLGEKSRKSEQVGEIEKNDSGRRASGCKRKLKVAATSNSNIDHDDKCFQSKCLRAEQESVLVNQSQSPCSSNSLKPVETEWEITHSLPEDSTAVGVEGCMSSLVQILEHDSVDDHDDESILHNQQRDVKESLVVHHSQAIDIPCSNNNIAQILESEGEMEYSLPEDSDTSDVEKYSSILDQNIEIDCTEIHADEGVQNKQQRAEEMAYLVQQNQLIELPCTNNILQFVESEEELLPMPDSLTFIVEEFLSKLDEVTEPYCKEDREHVDECIQSRPLYAAEDDRTFPAVVYEEWINSLVES